MPNTKPCQLDSGEVNPNHRSDQSQLIAEAHAAVLQQTKKDEFDAVPYERATELLELLPPEEFVDDRVRLALDITLATRTEYRPDLSRRALYAAFPSGGELKDTRLKRKWFTFIGIIEAASGNVERALRCKLIALELCGQLKDSYGFHAEWMGLANSSSGAGLYNDAVRYATLAIETMLDSGALSLHARGIGLLNRANALMRLGRLAEAEADVSASLMSITYPPNASVRNQIVLAQHMFAELRLESGDLSAARTALDAASTWADACGVPQYKLQIERVRARLSALDFGLEQAMSKLEELLEQALGLEAKFGQTSLDDTVLDVLHTIERAYREHGDSDSANKWLNAMGERLRTNATRMLDALADKPVLADEGSICAKMIDVDRYLHSRATAQSSTFKLAAPTWTYIVGLAANASGVEDPTKEHGFRVARLASLVARELGLPDATRRGIEAGCLVHDIGKVSVPASSLIKQSALDVGELNLYNAHPEVGAELLARVKHPEHGIVLNVVRFHHHLYGSDTSPSPIMGAAIPLEARITSVCDAYDSLVTGRPRSPAISSNEALREIFAQRSGKFDPTVVDVFVEIVRRLLRTYPDLQAYLSEDADSIEYFAMQRTLQRAAERALTNRISANRI